MLKKLALSIALSLTLVGGGIAASAGSSAAAPAAVSHAAPAVQLASTAAVLPAVVQLAPLSHLEMAQVQGDGLWKKFKKWAKRVWKKVVGVIVQEIVNAITEWLEEIFSQYTGGERLEGSEVRTLEYASQADYEAGNAYADYTNQSAWQQTEVWYDPPSSECWRYTYGCP